MIGVFREDGVEFGSAIEQVYAERDNARVNRATGLRCEFVSGVDGKIGDSQPSAERANPDAKCRFGSTLCYPDSRVTHSPHPSDSTNRSRAGYHW